MRIILHQATEAGSTGVRAQVSGFPVAGKTGTAQKVSKTGGYTKGEYISSFAGMIPANDPRFVIYVAVDNPREKYYGSEVAAPLFARVAGFAVRKSGLAPVTISKKDILPKEVHEKTNSAVKRIQETALVLNQADLNKTPDFTGLTLREVYQRLKGTDLEVKIKGRGRVAEMLPAPGDDLPESKTLRLILKE
jgi:cell division protein FtsI (penicillin-binding protein 3)